MNKLSILIGVALLLACAAGAFAWTDGFESGIGGSWVQGTTGNLIVTETTLAATGTTGVMANGEKFADPFIAMARPTGILGLSGAQVTAKLYLAGGVTNSSRSGIYITGLGTGSAIGSTDDDRAGAGMTFELFGTGTNTQFHFTTTTYCSGFKNGYELWTDAGSATLNGQWIDVRVTFAANHTFTADYKLDSAGTWTNIVTGGSLWGGSTGHPYWMPNYVQVMGTNRSGGEYTDDVTTTDGASGTVTGSVKVGGVGLGGATVQTTAGPTIGQSTTTGTDGNYSISLGQGSYTLQASKGASYTTSSIAGVAVTSGLTTSGVNFTLTSTMGTVSGTVKDTLNNPIGGATVTDGGSNTTSTATDGSYSLPLPAGTYNLTASKGAWYTPQQATGVVVTTGNTTTHNFSLTSLAGTINGTVYLGPTIVLPGATVSDSSGTYTTTSGSNGTYSLPIPAGTYTIQASKSGYCLTAKVTGVTVSAGGTTNGVDLHISVPGSNPADWSDNFESGLSAWTQNHSGGGTNGIVTETDKASSPTHGVTTVGSVGADPFIAMSRPTGIVDRTCADISARLYLASGLPAGSQTAIFITRLGTGTGIGSTDDDRAGGGISFTLGSNGGGTNYYSFHGTSYSTGGTWTEQANGAPVDQWVTFDITFQADSFTMKFKGDSQSDWTTCGHSGLWDGGSGHPFWMPYYVQVVGRNMQGTPSGVYADDVSVSSPPPGTVTGIVNGPSGPLSGATVTATAGGTGTTTTGTDGHYSLPLLPGTYTLMASNGPSYATSSVAGVSVTAGGTTSGVNFTLASTTGSVTGTVTGPSGALGGATVTVTEGPYLVGQSVTTASNGTYSIPLPGDLTNSYTLTASKGAFFTTSSVSGVIVATGLTTSGVNFTLASTAGTISGTVNGPAGGLGGATVTDSTGTYSTLSGTNGAYSLSVPAGVYAVQASKDGYCGLAQVSGVTVIAGNNTAGVNFTLSQDQTVWSENFESGLGAWTQNNAGGNAIVAVTEPAGASPTHGVQANGSKLTEPFIAMARATGILDRACAHITARLYMASGLPANSQAAIYITRLSHDNTSTTNGIGSLDDDRAGGGMSFQLYSNGTDNHYAFHTTGYTTGNAYNIDATGAPVGQWVTFDLYFNADSFTAKFKGDNDSSWTPLVTNGTLYDGGVKPAWMPNYVQVVGNNAAGGTTGVYVDDVNVYAPTVPALVSGTVTGPSGLLAGATVSDSSGAYLSIPTGTDGHYSLYLPAGPFTLTASANGYIPSSASVVVTNGQTLTQNFTLGALGSINGAVTLNSIVTTGPAVFDKSLLDIRVELRTHGSTSALQTVIISADSSGNYTYSFVGLLPGTYDVAFYAPGFVRSVVPATVVPTTPITVNGSLVNGDVDHDNEITTTDLSTVFKNMDQLGDN